MNEPWKRGDQALCINSDGWYARGGVTTNSGPTAGQVFTVTGIWYHCFPEEQIEALTFASWPHDSFDSRNFVKVSPGHQIEGDEIEREAFTKGNPWKVPA